MVGDFEFHDTDPKGATMQLIIRDPVPEEGYKVPMSIYHTDDEILELANKVIDSRITRGEALADPIQAGAYFSRKLRTLPHEVFACIFLDTRHRIIAYEELFRGTVDGSEVHPREVARRALHFNAAAVIFGHNHPSGNPEASTADRAVTARLKQALALIETRVLDHFIIGDGGPTSMAERGWL